MPHITQGVVCSHQQWCHPSLNVDVYDVAEWMHVKFHMEEWYYYLGHFLKSGADIEFYLKVWSHNHRLLHHHPVSLLLYCESYLSGTLSPVNMNWHSFLNVRKKLQKLMLVDITVLSQLGGQAPGIFHRNWESICVHCNFECSSVW